jgi:hypothetical protein
MDFTPTQQQTLLSKMGYDGPANPKMMEAFLASNPGAAAKMGKFNRALQKKSPRRGLAPGGAITAGTRSTSEADMSGFFYNGRFFDSYAKAAAARQKDLVAQATSQTTNTTTTGTTSDTTTGTTSDTTTGTTQEPYDPTAGTPPVKPELPSEITNYAEGLSNGWAKGIGDMLRSGEIPEDLSGWTVTGTSGNYSLNFKDGTSVPLTMARYDDEGPSIQQYLDKVASLRDNQLKTYNEGLEGYNTQLADYNAAVDEYVSGLPAGSTIDLNTAKQNVSNLTQKLANAARLVEENPDNQMYQSALEAVQKEYAEAQANLNIAQTQFGTTGIPTPGEAVASAITTPEDLTTKATVDTIGTATTGQLIGAGTGQTSTPRTADTITTSGTTLTPENAAQLVQYFAVNKGKLPPEYEGKGIDTSKFDINGDGEINNRDALLFARGEGTLSYGGTPTAQAAGPTVTGAATYDAAQAAGGIKEELQGVERDYKLLTDTKGLGFKSEIPEGGVAPAVMETFHNPTTGEYVIFNSGGNIAPEGWVKGPPPGKFKTEGLKGAVGEVSQTITAAEMDPTMLAQLNLPAEQINIIREVVDNGDLEITEDQLAEAATLANQGIPLPEAISQVTNLPQDVVAAKFKTPTPEAIAQTEFDLGQMGSAERDVTQEELATGQGRDLVAEQSQAEQTLYEAKASFAKGDITADQLAKAQTEYDRITTEIAQSGVTSDELVKAQGLGLDPEQSAETTAEYKDNLEAAKGKVESGELVDPKTNYNLPPAESAVLNETVVQDAAKTEIPDAEAAQSSFESTVEGAAGLVGGNELVNAKDVVAVAEAIEATAATMEALDEAAKMKAATGTLSESALAIAEQGTVPASATVSGQMTKLMEQFNDGTPAWAAGAMRAANAAMAARGLGASSMAGAAIVQASMEAAMPIAQADAQMFMQMEMTNLDNRQQVALANAAAHQNIELTNLSNMQQAALQNSTNAFALQTQNLSNLQAVVLANAQMKQALQGQVLDVYTQAAVVNAARYAEMNNLNLNNEQQALLQRSAQNLQVDLTNLDARQQTALANLQVMASLRGQELSNEQQVAMLQSTQAFQAAEFTANAKQQALLQDASARAAMEGKVLDIHQQTALFNASRIATVNDVNLTNEQQIRLQKSAENLQVDLANLSSRQQTELANAQLRAALQGKVLDNEQQAAVLNAARYTESNNLNLTNRQQAFMQDANIRAAMDGKVLDNQQQAELYNVSRVAEVQDININNEQQALILQTTQNLQADMANLSNRQQTALANAQLRAALQGQVLNNEQQAEILNAERYAEVNDINLSNKQQAFVQEYVAKTTMEGKALDNRQQTAIFNIANQIEERGIELNNEQQTILYNQTNKINVDLANLSNRQQTALANAQIEAALRGQELTNAQQTGTLNAARISEIANINFTADQQRAIQNSKLAQTVDVENLNARSAKLLADASAMAQTDLTNLNNRQQAQVQNAQNFLQMDLANLDNEQQTDMFTSQAIINSMLSDQAAENAALQFNAASENQVNQFFENLAANVSQFNAAQTNAINQFNAGEENATSRFNAQLEAARDQFNASNSLIIAQANAKWNQTISTIDTAEQNEANRNAALTSNSMTLTALNELFQKERDLMDYAFTANESAAARALSILLADKEADLTKFQEAAREDAAQGYLGLKIASDVLFTPQKEGTTTLFDRGVDTVLGWLNLG